MSTQNPWGLPSVSVPQRAPRDIVIPEVELRLTYARSSGPGGQNVNKVSSKAVLHWDVEASAILTAKEKETVREKLSSRINKAGELVLETDQFRDQSQNRIFVIKRLNELLRVALTPPIKRVATKPTRGSRERRLEDKKRQAQKKEGRGRKEE